MSPSYRLAAGLIVAALACSALLVTVTGCDESGSNVAADLTRATNNLVVLLNNHNSTAANVALYLVSTYSYNGLTAEEQAEALKADWPGHVDMMGRTDLGNSVVRVDLAFAQPAVAGQSAAMTGTGILYLGFQTAADQARFTSVRWVSLQGSSTIANAPTVTDLKVNGTTVNALTGAALGPVAPGSAVTITGQTDADTVSASVDGATDTSTDNPFTIVVNAPATAGTYVVDVQARKMAGTPAITTGLRRIAAEIIVQ